jgi:hypothetical protein
MAQPSAICLCGQPLAACLPDAVQLFTPSLCLFGM